MQEIPVRPRRLAVTGLALVLLAGGLFGASGATGQESDPESEPDAAFLFAYRPLPGQEEDFRAGYRRHLDWHRSHQDPLVWYGWTVLTGDRPGLFIDGVFGVPFSALDRRVDPTGDAADMAENVRPFARPVFRTAYRVRSELSTASRLESRDPSPLVTVIRVQLHPGTEPRFEEVLRGLKDAGTGESPAPEYSCYELVTGGPEPSFLLMIPASSLAELGAAPSTLSGLAAVVLPAAEAAAARAELTRIVREISNETWRYLPGLSYFPQDESTKERGTVP